MSGIMDFILKLKALFYISMIISGAMLLTASAACSSDGDGDGDGTPSDTSTPRATRPVDFPEGFPDEFPLYPGATYQQGVHYEQQLFVLFTSPDSRPIIAEFYRDRLQAEPWTLESEAGGNSGQILIMTFRNDDTNLLGSVTLASGDSAGETIINAIFLLGSDSQ